MKTIDISFILTIISIMTWRGSGSSTCPWLQAWCSACSACSATPGAGSGHSTLVNVRKTHGKTIGQMGKSCENPWKNDRKSGKRQENGKNIGKPMGKWRLTPHGKRLQKANWKITMQSQLGKSTIKKNVIFHQLCQSTRGYRDHTTQSI